MIDSVSMIKPLSLEGDSTASAGMPISSVSGQDAVKSFSDYLKDSLSEVNKLQIDSQKASQDLLVGNVKNIHETMLAVQKASLSLSLISTIRSKALSAYQEIMRMSV